MVEAGRVRIMSSGWQNAGKNLKNKKITLY